MKDCENLNEVRESIDRIDTEIVKLIAKRSYYVKQAANLKKDTKDIKSPKRVELIIDKVRKLAEENNLEPGIIEIVYRNMINSFIKLETEEHSRINNFSKG